MAKNLQFEWDPRKDAANVRKHGMSFLYAARVFADPFVDTDVEGNDHGEIRWKAIGEIGGELVRVTYTTREEEAGETAVEVLRVISARKATRAEARAYRGDS